MAEQTMNHNDIQQPETATQADNGGQGGKMFTQEEVSRIVQERLAKQKANLEKPSDREQELNAKEARLTCKEYLLDSGAPAVFLDVLDTSDPEKFKAAVELLKKSGYGAPAQPAKPTKTGLSHNGGGVVGGLKDNDLADAFRPKSRR